MVHFGAPCPDVLGLVCLMQVVKFTPLLEIALETLMPTRSSLSDINVVKAIVGSEP